MAKATFPFKLSNRLDYYVKEMQLDILKSHNVHVTWRQISEDCGKFCGVTGHTIRMIKAGSSNPSVPLSFLIAMYFGTTVDEIFGIVPEEEGTLEKLKDWKPCGLE